jgi:DNA-binding transcriptional MocR family regulator
LGPVWSSHILQLVLVELLRDPVTTAVVAEARQTYQGRRRHLQTAVEDLGLTTTGADGFNLWVTVADERAAVRHLRERDVAVCPGAPFLFEPDGEEHVRVTCASVDSDVERIATLVAAAGRAADRRHAVDRHCRPVRGDASL